MARNYTMQDNRIRIVWKKVLFDTMSDELHRRFYCFKYSHPEMSENRCAYYVIKKSYSTTALQRFVDHVHFNFGRANPNWFFHSL